MRIDVTFSQTDMGFRPVFDTGVQLPDSGNGVAFIPMVSQEGILSWTNNGGLPNPAPVNIKGKDGVNGKNGIDGQDGYTPVKGKDYWTTVDVAQMIAEVVDALPVYSGEVV